MSRQGELDKIRARMVLASSTMPPAASMRAKRTNGLTMISMGELEADVGICCSVSAGMLIHWLPLNAAVPRLPESPTTGSSRTLPRECLFVMDTFHPRRDDGIGILE